MSKKKVLYISGSLGLGHMVRDLSIAAELRTMNPEVELSWLASHPASMLIEEAGEKLHPEATLFANDNVPAEKAARKGYRLDLQKYLIEAVKDWEQNVKAFELVVSKERFDLVVADEAYEISMALANGRVQTEVKFVMMYDFFGNDSMTWNPLEWLGTYLWNREWAKVRDMYDGEHNVALFFGEPEDVPDTSLGLFLPNRRNLAKEVCRFVGYVLPFDPSAYAATVKVRAALDYGPEPLVICSVGGTAAGKELLTLCAKAYPIIREQIPDLRMVLVCGPRISPHSLEVPQGVELKGYVPSLYKHFAASDLSIIQGGGTTTLELTALRRPFLYFPLEGHFEQQVHVSRRLARHGAGIKMSYPRTTPESLSEKVVANIGREVTYDPIDTDGARRAAAIIDQFL